MTFVVPASVEGDVEFGANLSLLGETGASAIHPPHSVAATNFGRDLDRNTRRVRVSEHR